MTEAKRLRVLLLVAALGSGLMGCRRGRLSPERMRTIGLGARTPHSASASPALAQKTKSPAVCIQEGLTRSRRLANSGRRETNNRVNAGAARCLTLVSRGAAEQPITRRVLTLCNRFGACVRQRIYPHLPPPFQAESARVHGTFTLLI